MLGTSDAWSMSRSSHRPSEPAYYIEDCRILSVISLFCTCYKSLEYPILNSVFVSIGKNSDGRTVGHVWHAVVVQ